MPSDLTILSDLFDTVFVISLPASMDRRDYVRRHLADNGIVDFEFFRASSPDDHEVSEAYQSGLVAKYPPCFRCGGLDCGNPACNNVLIPAQVACFVTYLRLWKEIAARGGRALVLEDDVRLEARFWPVLAEIRARVTQGTLPFTSDRPCLLRLGWGRTVDHAREEPLRIETDVLMANPCHAITAPFAAALIERFIKIDQTSDIFQHQVAPRDGEAFTIFPPIASELSSSEGALESLIHPKKIRTEWLIAHGDLAGAAENDQKIARHFQRMTPANGDMEQRKL